MMFKRSTVKIYEKKKKKRKTEVLIQQRLIGPTSPNVFHHWFEPISDQPQPPPRIGEDMEGPNITPS